MKDGMNYLKIGVAINIFNNKFYCKIQSSLPEKQFVNKDG